MLALALLAFAQPPELGRVPWVRGYDEAVTVSKRTGKPLLVLFDEVPGCSTVNAYGKDTLSDPFVVDASQLFVAVFVSNNETGADRETLRAFGEPTWNNPVLRIVDDGKTLARVTHESGTPGLLSAMVRTLDETKRTVPDWLRVVAQSPDAKTVTKTFTCTCFWEAEARLGALPGVVSTEAGFANSREVVRVEVARDRAAALDDVASAAGYTPNDGKFSRAGGDDDKHALARSPWAKVAMTSSQRTKVNAAIAAGDDPTRYLAPWQRR